MTLAPPFRASVPWLDDAIAELEEDGFAPHQPGVQPAPPSYTRTEVTERILKYVTDEFNEGAAGNRDSLPSTRDIAQACVRGYGKDKSCRRVLAHLNRLMWSGEVIQVRDKEENPRYSFNRVYWAMPNSGREASARDMPVAVAVSGPPRDVAMRGSQIDHRGCDHPLTRVDRERCRREWLYMDVSDL